MISVKMVQAPSLNLYLIFTVTLSAVIANGPLPIVIWHGMGDTCCGAGSMGYIKNHLQQQLSNVYVNSLMIGDNVEQDFANSYFMDSNEQVDYACKVVTQDQKLKNGFNLMGFSQGGQFARALVQRCANISVANLITFGAQHQGVYGLPHCIGSSMAICNLIRKLISYGAYESYVQEHLVQAQYWHDPLKEQEYVEKSLFLADINNVRKDKKPEYKERLLALKSFVMVVFNNDTMVQPVASEAFGFYVEGQTKAVQTLQETNLYKEDWLGLRKLDATNRIKFYFVEGDHLHITMDFFNKEIIDKYLR